MSKGINLTKRLSPSDCTSLIEAVLTAAIRQDINVKITHNGLYRVFFIAAFDRFADRLKAAFPDDAVLLESIAPRCAKITLYY
jgi:hypothetical protein